MKSKIMLWLSGKVPRQLRYWVVVRAFADASFIYRTTEPDCLGYSKVMKAFDDDARS